MQVKPARDRRPLLIAAVFALLFVSGLGAWPAVSAQVCPSILVASSNEKYLLMASLADEYSSKHPGRWPRCGPAVHVDKVASGDAERRLAKGWTGKDRPDVWSPAASTWVDLLSAHLEAAGQAALVAAGQPESIAISPLVVAMPKPMATAMGWPKQPGWRELLELANHPSGWGLFNHREWGSFRLGKTDPQKSTSGLHSLIAAYYAATQKTTDLTNEDLLDSATQKFVKDVEASVSHYAPTVGSFLDNLAVADAAAQSEADSLSYISALAVEEQEMFHYNEGKHGDIAPNVPLVAIYPADGTLVADHPYVLLDEAAVSQAKRRLAMDFLAWLRAPDQQDRFVDEGFRDYGGRARGRLLSDKGVIADQPRRKLYTPRPSIVAEIQKNWQKFRKSARIVILVAPANKSQRTDVRAGIDELSEGDEVAVWTLEPGQGTPAVVFTSVRNGRQAINVAIDSAPMASGRVPLYSTIKTAYAYLKTNSDPARINALVVITANRDDDLGPNLTDLQQGVRTRAAGVPIRIYTVALNGSDEDALEKIEKSSGGVAFSSPDAAEAIRTALANF